MGNSGGKTGPARRRRNSWRMGGRGADARHLLDAAGEAELWPGRRSCGDAVDGDGQTGALCAETERDSRVLASTSEDLVPAEGLELTGRPFLWVVRPDFTAGLSKEWLDDFQQRVAGTGMIVSWCSQQQVLAHRAVACFVSHCGWNSTLEASRNGVPVLCWPYFCDQFLDRSYISDVWRTGLAVSPGEDGVVAKEEVRSKVEKIISDPGFRKRAGWLKDTASECVGEGGSSYNNFTRFVDLLSE